MGVPLLQELSISWSEKWDALDDWNPQQKILKPKVVLISVKGIIKIQQVKSVKDKVNPYLYKVKLIFWMIP